MGLHLRVEDRAELLRVAAESRPGDQGLIHD